MFLNISVKSGKELQEQFCDTIAGPFCVLLNTVQRVGAGDNTRPRCTLGLTALVSRNVTSVTRTFSRHRCEEALLCPLSGEPDPFTHSDFNGLHNRLPYVPHVGSRLAGLKGSQSAVGFGQRKSTIGLGDVGIRALLCCRVNAVGHLAILCF